jgi:hypothetical protein
MNLGDVLWRAWRSGFSTKSDFARHMANEVAVAACLGLITTKISGKTFGNTWYITKKGLEYHDECFQHDRV